MTTQKVKAPKTTIPYDKQTKNWAFVLLIWLTFMFLITGIFCFLTWLKSGFLEIFGWSWNNPGATTLQQMIYALSAGTLGSTSFCYWSIFEHYCHDKDFNTIWVPWYIFGPIHGSLLGLATYSLVVGGLFVLGDTVSLRTNWAIFALAFLTGFSSKRVLRKIHEIAGTFFTAAKTSEVPD